MNRLISQLKYFILITSLYSSATLSADVLGIGGPALDIIIPVTDSFLTEFNVTKGSVGYINQEKASQIINSSGDAVHYSPGGLNAIRALANLDIPCAVIGVIGDDSAGQLFEQSLTDAKIVSYLRHCTQPTTNILCLITPDMQRTMLIVSGAGGQLSIDDLKPKYFAGKKLVHIEGIFMKKPDLVERAMQLAKEANAEISFQLPKNFALIEKEKETILRLLKQYVDIVFGNEEQAKHLLNLDAEQACNKLQHMCDIAAITAGKNGCWVGQNNKIHHIPALPAKVVDTTGAGDLFAAGFLLGHLQKKNLEECAFSGILFSKIAIEQYGATVLPDTLIQGVNTVADYLNERCT